MNMYLIVTRSGTFIAIGKDEREAKVNFSKAFPNEKIREIEKHKGESIQVSHLMWDLD
ncbi:MULTISPECIES: hypothetical protein [Bacillus subtilis group]|uniref:hypothetical protein n=1 Tax=Bacillus TaxID=1386 RepID=UPI001643CE0C|nr:MULTISPECIES: hypothetical protein [Bacillus subtilis group]MBT3123205.1 hypothetical protein [Bacillus inaquosorum]MCB4340523.1 hypothetical protein [Bacillus subtilis]MCB5337338.1 hypothetical protein [Bacillus amyloliquefaciens]MCF7615378.1 hypothetical protein [Bacillus subtilis]QWK35305.1 hypothetical protein KM843_20580 [Bacillus velezensis]